MITPIIYLNGQFLTADEAKISPFDRGFLFAHAAYEVTAVYNGQLIDFDAHLARLGRTLDGLEIPHLPDDLVQLHKDLIARNKLTEGLVYLQITAGNYGFRDFYGPEDFTPSVFMFATEKPLIGDVARNGLTAITLPDTRWTRRDMKTTQLVSQTLAYRKARRAGADTAFLQEGGMITEAASANAWIVLEDGTLVTRDLSNALLPGITRQTLLSILAEAGLRTEERAFTVAEAKSAAECFTSSTGVVIAPAVSYTHLTLPTK